MGEPQAHGVSPFAMIGGRTADPSQRNTRVLTAFTAVTNLADGMTKVALPLVATALTTSPSLVSGVVLTLSLPWLMTALHVGVLVDRADRRRLLWLANAIRVTVISALLAAIAWHVVRLAMVYASAAALGVAEVIALTSASAMIPDAVAPALRERANVWVTAAETLCNELLGPFLGGLLVAVSAAAALGTSTGCYVIAIVILPLLIGRFKVTRAADTPLPPVNKQVADGLRFLWRQPLLRLFSLTVAVLITCWAAWFALMPLVATKDWGLSPLAYGSMVGALGFGGIVGTLTVRTANRLFGHRLVMFANVFLTSSMVAIPALTANAWAAGAGAFLGGMGGTLWVVNSRTISQALVSPEMMGRYNSVARLFSWGPIPLGAALAGGLAQFFGYRLAFGVVAVASLAVIVPFLRVFKPGVLAGPFREPNP